MSKHEIGCLNHCPRGGHGGGSSLLTWVICGVVALVALGGYHVRRGIDTGLHVLLDIAEITFLLVIVTVLAWVTWKVYRWRKAQQTALPAPYRITQLSTRDDPAQIAPWQTKAIAANRARASQAAIEASHDNAVDWASVRVNASRPRREITDEYKARH